MNLWLYPGFRDTKVHFEGKYRDVYTIPTANQRHVFNMLGLPYKYKDVQYNLKPKAGEQTGTDIQMSTQEDDGVTQVPNQ